MSNLKTLKDLQGLHLFTEGIVGKHKDGYFVRCDVLKQEAIRHVKNVQTGGFDRRDFPEFLKGSMAKSYWEESMFQYGMEYGFIWALWMFFNLTEEKLK